MMIDDSYLQSLTLSFELAVKFPSKIWFICSFVLVLPFASYVGRCSQACQIYLLLHFFQYCNNNI